MKILKTKITMLADKVKTIELESYQIDIENGHDVKCFIGQKHESLYRQYQPYLNTLYRSIEDEFLADQVYAMILQEMVNLSLLNRPDNVVIGFFQLLSDAFFWPTQDVFLGREEGIALLKSILKYSFDLFVSQEYRDLPGIYSKFNVEISRYLEENGCLPQDMETLFDTVFEKRQFH